MSNVPGSGGLINFVKNGITAAQNAQQPGLAPVSPGGSAINPSAGTPGFGLTAMGQLPALDLSQVTDTSGSNAIFNSLQNAVQGLRPVNAQTSAAQLGAAPQFAPASGATAQGTAGQGSAATGSAATMGPSIFNAALSNAAGYNPSQGNASTMTSALGGPASYSAALGGNASNVGGVTGSAALAGSPALAGYANILNAAQGGFANTGPTSVSTAGDAAWQAQQQELANTLGIQASGGGVSPADLQLKQGTDANIAAQLAVLGSQRGNTGNAGLAIRSAADQGAAANAQLNQQMGIQRAQETLAAQNALGNVLGTARGQSQAYNADQAALNQQTSLANLANAQGATMQNSAFNQNSLLANLNNIQNSLFANQNAQNQGAQFNAGQNQAINLANMNAGLQGQEFNAGANNTLQSLNLGALNAANAGNAQLGQGMTLANLQNSQAAASQNAQQYQAMTLANLLAQNQAGAFNAGNVQQTGLANQNATNAALSQSSAQSQAAALANMGATNQLTGLNLSNLNAMDLANLQATNQFGLNNVNNAQQTALANLANAQQSNLANQNALSQFGLQQGAFNQQTSLANASNALASQQQFMSQYLASLGLAGTVDEQQAQNALAAAQLTSGQNIAQANINAGLAVSNAQANANLLGAGVGAGGALLGGLLALSDENLKTGIGGGNPMMQSFLEDYRRQVAAARPAPLPAQATFRAPEDSGGGLAAGIQAAGQSMLHGLNQMKSSRPNPMIAGTASGQAADYAAQAAGPGMGAESGMTLPPPTLSDDQQKENVISGNQGMQAFLQQANAQQNAQSNQGSTNNAFMQTGQAPSAQVDRQLPSYLGGNPNTGYGAPQGLSGPSITGSTQGNIGIVAGQNVGAGTAGGFQGGQVSGTNISNAGGFNPGQMQVSASAINGGDPTQSSTFGGGLSYQGGLTPAMNLGGGVDQTGGVTSQPMVTSTGSVAGGGVRSGGNPLQAAGTTIPPTTAPPLFDNIPRIPGTGLTSVPTVAPPIPAAPSPVRTPNLPVTAPTAIPPAAPVPTTVGSLGPATIDSTPISMPPPAAPPAATPVVPPPPMPSAPIAPTFSSIPPGASVPSVPTLPPAFANFPISILTGTPAASPPLNFSMLSDEKQKQDTSKNPEDIEQMLDKLHAYSYQYKNPNAPGAAPGRRVGVMAQDLERSPLGASFVRDTPQGKMVDYGQAAGTMMAGLAYHNERLDNHEAMLRRILSVQ